MLQSLSCHCTEWCCCRAGPWARHLQPGLHLLSPLQAHCPVPGPLGDGKRAESQVLSVLLPVQRLLSGTAAGATHVRWPWGHPSLSLCLVFSPRVWRGRSGKLPGCGAEGCRPLEGTWEPASLLGFGSASLAVALCQLKASVRLLYHFPRKIEFGTKVCPCSVVFPSLQPAEGSGQHPAPFQRVPLLKVYPGLDTPKL